jgi:hypothetical protein
MLRGLSPLYMILSTIINPRLLQRRSARKPASRRNACCNILGNKTSIRTRLPSRDLKNSGL